MASPKIPTEIPTEIPAEIGAEVDDWIGTALRVGVDMVDTPELADMIDASGPSFMDLCWTPAEQAYCAGSITRLAARWAAKEATMKALGHGIGEVDPVDVEVVSAEGEPPALQLHGSAAALARELRISHLAVSLTHEANAAVAFVVAVADGCRSNPGAMRLASAGADVVAHRSHVIKDGVSIANRRDGWTDGGQKRRREQRQGRGQGRAG